MQAKRILWAKSAVILAAVPVLLWANSNSSAVLAPGYVGAPGDLGSCTSSGCHLGTANNPANKGTVNVNFLQAGLTYAPGVKQHLTITISDPGQRTWGFQLTVRQAASPSTTAGALASTDTQTQLFCAQPGNLAVYQFISFPSSPNCSPSNTQQYLEQSQVGFNVTQGTSGTATFSFDWTPPASNVGNITFYVAALAGNGDATANGDHIYTTTYTLLPLSTVTSTYYFPHLALGGGWQTVLTYVNYSQQAVTCETNFLADNGSPLLVNFGGTPTATRTDVLAPGAELHQISQNDPNTPQVGGWAQGQCTGPLKASLLFRSFTGAVATAEAGVNASTIPTTKFVTYAQTLTGVAFANPSATLTATVAVVALDNLGKQKGNLNINLPPGAHVAQNVNSMFGLNSFNGSVQIVSTIPIVSLSINAEASSALQLVVSSLPPGDLGPATQLANGSGNDNGQGGNTFSFTYYFPHFAISGGWQTLLTYVNYSGFSVTCNTNFLGDNGAALPILFEDSTAGASSTRRDVLSPGGEIHVLSQADLTLPQVTGWAQGQCTGPVKASLLFRYYPNRVTAAGEAGVNASTAGATKFVTYAQTQAGIAYANVSLNSATLTIIAVDATGAQLGSALVNLLPGAHDSKNIGPLLGLNNFNGSVQIISTQPIVSLSINAEAFPAFSSLPPGDLDGATPLSTGH